MRGSGKSDGLIQASRIRHSQGVNRAAIHDPAMTPSTRPLRPTRPLKEEASSTAAAQAAEAGLVYVSDDDPGISRRRAGKGFAYRQPNGDAVRDAATLQRIRALAIPPAYTEVWICRNARGHLQATGRDARRRKQYRYHAQWSAIRGDGKFDRIVAFGKALPKLRRRLRRDLALPGWPREKVLALVVAVMADTLVRVGNEGYARDNKSFGLTTLRNRHAEFVSGGRARLRFKGKGGQDHDIDPGRQAPGQAGPRRAAAARAGAVPVPRRRRRSAAGGFGRGQRLPARGHGRELHRQGFPHLGRHAGGVPAAGGDGTAEEASERELEGAAERSRSSRWPMRWAIRPRSAARPTSIPAPSPAGARAACNARRTARAASGNGNRPR